MPAADEIRALQEALAREQEARQEAEAARTEAQRARQQFVSLVTHELRAPMTSIKGYTDLLLKGIMGPLNEAQTNFLQTVRSNVERMARMVADLGDINKLDGQTLTFTLAAVALDTVLNEVLKPLTLALAQKEQTVARAIPAEFPALWCDHDRLAQVLSNLFSNAHLYTPAGGLITVSAECAPGAPVARVVVQDNGIGIVPEEQHRVFELFFRASDEETRRVPGNGLALHLSRRLIERQDGQLFFESTRGVGSTFILELPTQSGA